MGSLKLRAMGFHTGHRHNDLKIRFDADPIAVERANKGFALHSPLLPLIEMETSFFKGRSS